MLNLSLEKQLEKVRENPMNILIIENPAIETQLEVIKENSSNIIYIEKSLTRSTDRVS